MQRSRMSRSGCMRKRAHPFTRNGRSPRPSARRIASQHLVSITPLRDARAEPVYLSTGGVAAAIVRQAGDPRRLGKVAVVGFADHIKRCVDTSRRAGLDAAAPAGYAMPMAYDADSGQPWTRSRLVYLLHDVMCRIEDRRNELIAGG